MYVQWVDISNIGVEEAMVTYMYVQWVDISQYRGGRGLVTYVYVQWVDILQYTGGRGLGDLHVRPMDGELTIQGW